MSKHGLNFFIEGAAISVDEMGKYVTKHMFSPLNFVSEREMEEFSDEIAHQIFHCVAEKVEMTKISNRRKQWEHDHPPNHAGYYYCHLCAGWVHREVSDLDHVTPKSVRRGEDPDRDDNLRMAHSWPVYDNKGKMICPGNRGKGSRTMPSKTMEIAPQDEAL